MKAYNNIIVTGANSQYFDSLLTLISSIHKDSFEIIDKIFVYDFGLQSNEIQRLGELEKVEYVELDKNMSISSTISTIKTKCHFWKIFACYDCMSVSKRVLWLDAGVCALKSVKPIFDIIEAEDIFLVGDVHINRNFTHKKCEEIMNATEKELNDHQLSSGIFGYKSDGKFSQLIIDSWKYAQIEGCVDGFENNHRHDQSVLSILASRYGCVTQDIDIYGYWTDFSRNLEKAIALGSVIFVHRRDYDNKSYLISKK